MREGSPSVPLGRWGEGEPLEDAVLQPPSTSRTPRQRKKQIRFPAGAASYMRNKKSADESQRISMAPPVGLEPTTFRLTAERSTD